MTAQTVLVSALIVAGAAASLHADRIKLRSGTVIEGMFIGGDSDSVRVLLENGKVSEVPLSEAVAVESLPGSRLPPHLVRLRPQPPPPRPSRRPAPPSRSLPERR